VGDEAVVKLLLDTGKVDLNTSKDVDGWLRGGGSGVGSHDEAIAKLLLDTGEVTVSGRDTMDMQYAPLH
jgi:hypothetical protein